jgi:hypothetical protein
MKILFLLFSLSLLGLKACETESAPTPTEISETSNKADDLETLNNLKAEIEKLANSMKCSNAADWKITPLGAKPCGGPSGFIAYHKDIDTASFLSKIKTYTELNKKFNTKHGLMSDCSIIAEPSTVKCVDGKVALVY